MKFFETKKSLRAKIALLNKQLENDACIRNQITQYNNELADALERKLEHFPFNLGDVVYDIQLRGENGRYTKTKASREHSIVNEVVVDKKNYFKLADRLGTDVFTSVGDANAYLDSICVK